MHTKTLCSSRCTLPAGSLVFVGETQRTNDCRAFARQSFVQARFFPHSVFIRLLFETYSPIGFSSFPSPRRPSLTASLKRRYRSLRPPAALFPFACLHYTANALICQDFLTIWCENSKGQAQRVQTDWASFCKGGAQCLQRGRLCVQFVVKSQAFRWQAG